MPAYSFSRPPCPAEPLVAQLVSLGVPAPMTVLYSEGLLVLIFMDPLTGAQNAALSATVPTWDLDGSKSAAYFLAQRRARAKDALTDTIDPHLIALRNALRVVYASLVEQRQAHNALVAWAQTKGYAGSPLPVRTWPMVLAAARAQIDAETDPSQLT